MCRAERTPAPQEGPYYLADRHSDSADATVTLERAALNRLVLREVAFTDALARGLVRVDGDGAKGA
jgi:alkyl sulfatase BDS1-like metallo-beta-lactamase superfamily hydrolase